MEIFNRVKFFLEKIDRLRDKALFSFIKPYWPRAIKPNHLTIIRIVIGLYLFLLLFYFKDNNGYLVIPLFLAGALTDMLDGSVARGLKEETKLGAMLDSTADRILIIPIAIYSLFSSYKELFMAIILFEIINAFVAIYGQGKDILITSNIFGKTKMVLQSIVFLGILLFWPKPPNIYFIYLLWFSLIFIVLSIYVKLKDIFHLKYGPHKNL